MKKDINQFNSPNTLLVITTYPTAVGKKRGGKEYNAIGWHAEKTLKYLSQNRKVIVFAEKIRHETTAQYKKNLIIKRLWRKSSPWSLISNLLISSLKLNQIKSVLVPFEFNIFGGIIPNLIIVLILGILRLFGKSVTIELHQVILDVKKLVKHVNISNPIAQKFYNISLRLYYLLMGLVANNLIVFEQDLKQKLSPYIPEEKISVLSLAAESKKTFNRIKARQIIKLPKKPFTVMVFGYINGYKGIDWIINSFKKIKNNNVHLLIAGGKNPYLRGGKYYEKFYQSIVNAVDGKKNITHTGFIDEKLVPIYFAAADLVVLPYEVFISASGPFSLALTYSKPVILSQALINYSQSQDFMRILKLNRLKLEEVFFSLNGNFNERIERIKRNQKLYHRLTSFAKQLGEARNISNVKNQYLRILFTEKEYNYLAFSPKKLLKPSFILK